MKILVSIRFSEEQLAQLRALDGVSEVARVKLVNGRFPTDYHTSAQIYYGAGDAPTPTQAPNLQWIQSHFAGVDWLHENDFWQQKVLITSASGVHAPNMGQYALTHLCMWGHKVRFWQRHQRQSEWAPNRLETFIPEELYGKTLGILGYGSIGRELARLVQPFNMRVLATKRDPTQLQDDGYTPTGTGDPQGILPDHVYAPSETAVMVRQCDYVVIILPLTNETHHLFNREMLQNLKPTAYLLNIGRGGIIDETALVEALEQGTLAGAGLDVFEEEPLPADSPLWQMENVVITPHTAGLTPHYKNRVFELFYENVQRFLANKPLINQVNRKLGY